MNAAVRLVRLLRGKGLTVTTAESMTGGLIAGAITSVPGASEVLSLALCTYSNEAKRRFLGVSAQQADEPDGGVHLPSSRSVRRVS